MSAFDKDDIVGQTEQVPTKGSAFDSNDIVIEQPKKEKPTRKESFMAGAEQGATLGFADEIGGAMQQGMSLTQDLLHKLGIADNPSPYTQDRELGIDPDADPYIEGRDMAREKYKAAEQAYQSKIPFTDIKVNPYNFAGNVAGALATLPLMPAKAIAPVGQAAKLVPALDALSIGKNVASLGKTALNSVPLSAATGIGISEGETVGQVADDAVTAATTGAVLSPLLQAGIPAVSGATKKTGEAVHDVLNLIPGEPMTRMKLGLKGILGVSVKTKKKIEDIINSQVGKFKDSVESKAANQKLQQDIGLHNIETQIMDYENRITSLTDDYHNLNTQRDSYKRDAILTKTDEKAGIIKSEQDRLAKEIKDLEAQRDSLLDSYQTRVNETIQNHESELAAVKAQKDILDQKQTTLKELRPQEIADSAQEAFQNDVKLVKQRYDNLDSQLENRNVKFNLDPDLNDFEKELSRFAGDDEVLIKANENIMKNLNKYKGGEIDRKEFIDLLNGYKNKYGKQSLSGLRKALKGAPANYEREYQQLFDGLENKLRETQDLQLRDWGHADLADGYKDVNQAYRTVKNLEPKYGNQDYSSKLVSEIKDLGKFGKADVNKGSKGIVKDISDSSEFFPNLSNILPEQIDPYVREATEVIPGQVMQNASKKANLETLLSDLRGNTKRPNKFSTNPEDLKVLNSVNDLEAQAAGQQEALRNKQFAPEKQSAINKLEQELDILKNDPTANEKYGQFTNEINANELKRKELLSNIQQQKQNKSNLLAPKEKTTQIDKMLAVAPVDREDYLRKLILAADKERTVGGAGSAVQKLDELQTQLNLPNSALDAERKHLQDLLSAYKDDVDFALSSSGNTAGNIGDFVGAASNITGYAANRLASPVALTKKVGDKVSNAIGTAKVIPTTGGMKNIEEILAKISNKPLDKVMEMDSVGQAALKNSLLQISPAVRQHLEKKDSK